MKKADKILWEGVEENDLKKVVWALNLGADVNAKDIKGRSPLLWAAYRDNEAIAKLLIEAGADVDFKGYLGRSLLHYAKSVEVAKLLISAGADVNSKDYNSRSPLLLAVAAGMGNVDLAKYLISAGADVDSKDNEGKSPLDYAHSKEMKELLEGAIT